MTGALLESLGKGPHCICEKERLSSVCVCAQTDKRLPYSHTLFLNPEESQNEKLRASVCAAARADLNIQVRT